MDLFEVSLKHKKTARDNNGSTIHKIFASLFSKSGDVNEPILAINATWYAVTFYTRK